MPNTPTQTDYDLGATAPTDLEEHTHPFGANTFAAKNVVEPIPAAFLSQKRLDYAGRSDDSPVYVGFNIRGAATSDTTWILQKLTYDGSSRVTLVQIAIDAWDNHDTTATYA